MRVVTMFGYIVTVIVYDLCMRMQARRRVLRNAATYEVDLSFLATFKTCPQKRYKRMIFFGTDVPKGSGEGGGGEGGKGKEEKKKGGKGKEEKKKLERNDENLKKVQELENRNRELVVEQAKLLAETKAQEKLAALNEEKVKAECQIAHLQMKTSEQAAALSLQEQKRAFEKQQLEEKRKVEKQQLEEKRKADAALYEQRLALEKQQLEEKRKADAALYEQRLALEKQQITTVYEAQQKSQRMSEDRYWKMAELDKKRIDHVFYSALNAISVVRGGGTGHGQWQPVQGPAPPAAALELPAPPPDDDSEKEEHTSRRKQKKQKTEDSRIKDLQQKHDEELTTQKEQMKAQKEMMKAQKEQMEMMKAQMEQMQKLLADKLAAN